MNSLLEIKDEFIRKGMISKNATQLLIAIAENCDFKMKQNAEFFHKAEAEVERLRGFERTAKWLSDTWNEFEKPIPLDANIQDILQNLHEWASDWCARAEKAEAELAEAGTAAWKLAQENQRLQERVRELEAQLDSLQQQPDEPRYVTREMAIDAGDPDLEGQKF